MIINLNANSIIYTGLTGQRDANGDIMVWNNLVWEKTIPPSNELDTLVQGEPHGIDNDVEHVEVWGTDCQYYTGSQLKLPGVLCPDVSNKMNFSFAGIFDRRPLGVDIVEHPDESRVVATMPRVTKIYDPYGKRFLWVRWFQDIVSYDGWNRYRKEPMYTHSFVKLRDGELPHVRFHEVNRYYRYYQVVIPLTGGYQRCYHDGTIYEAKSGIQSDATIMIGGNYWGVYAYAPYAVNRFDLPTREDCYYDCLRLLPQFHGSARSRVFEESCDGIGHISSNNIANAQQVLDILGCLFKRDVKGVLQIPKTISEAWLWYRYTYTTTKLDLAEIREKTSHGSLTKQTRYTSYSSLVDPREDHDVKWTCGVTVHEQWNDLADKCNSMLYRLGLYPGLVNLWDMIPFSFVVDWFLPIGDLAQQLETNMRFNSSRYVFERINYSVHCSMESLAYPGLSYYYYKRWSEDGPPPARFWVGGGTYQPSTATVTKRFIDGVCLVVGKGG